MGEAAAGYSVLLRDSQASPKPADLAQALSAVQKAPMHDFLAQARRAHGIAASGLPKEQADALVRALESKALRAVSLPDSLVEDPPAAQPCGALQLSPEGLAAKPAAGDWTAVFAWPRLAVLAAAVVKERQRKAVKERETPGLKEQALRLGLTLTTGLPMGLGGKKEVEKVVETTELAYYADLVFPEPRVRLRVDAQDFDFSCLGARMGPAAAANFRRLVVELAEGAPKALRGPGAQALLTSSPLSQLAYDGLEDLDRECRWLLTLETLG